jgi:hypothetical protein
MTNLFLILSSEDDSASTISEGATIGSCCAPRGKRGGRDVSPLRVVWLEGWSSKVPGADMTLQLQNTHLDDVVHLSTLTVNAKLVQST